MTPDERSAIVRQHLEAAVRLQRESWDEALALQEITGDQDRDIYEFVAELAAINVRTLLLPKLTHRGRLGQSTRKAFVRVADFSLMWIGSGWPTILQLSDFILYSGISEIHVPYLTDSCRNANGVEATRVIR